MRTCIILCLSAFIIASCKTKDPEALKVEIFQTEKAFEKMTADQGVAEAFYFYADDNAVIKRENDTLITGKENIRTYYNKIDSKNTTVAWTADFVDVDECGKMGYTYGKYQWKIHNADSSVTTYKGVFHTVWKKQKDGSWKYVWD